MAVISVGEETTEVISVGGMEVAIWEGEASKHT
jgi:hypothetical protein